MPRNKNQRELEQFVIDAASVIVNAPEITPKMTAEKRGELYARQVELLVNLVTYLFEVSMASNYSGVMLALGVVAGVRRWLEKRKPQDVPDAAEARDAEPEQ